ncbi:hypothetical protein C0580_05025 [Candidatus Parcubacteria bacterium]|nr:MAG: hypothetical protein C0580_05025 [Candidatus Parcubacteria bacterium]
MKKISLFILLPIAFIALIYFLFNSKVSDVNVAYGQEVTVYKSPTCGCCVNYIGLLEDRGYEVKVVETEDMASIKDKYGVPRDMESCHTSIFGDYVVEGHVPFEVVENMLSEEPDIKGIALPDMPSGSPGMPGPKREPFVIYALSDQGSEVYLEN